MACQTELGKAWFLRHSAGIVEERADRLIKQAVEEFLECKKFDKDAVQKAITAAKVELDGMNGAKTLPSRRKVCFLFSCLCFFFKFVIRLKNRFV